MLLKKIRFILFRLRVSAEETVGLCREWLVRKRLPFPGFYLLPPGLRRAIGLSGLVLIAVILFYSVFQLFANVPLRGIRPDDCIVQFDEDQIERFKKMALRLDRLPGLDVSLHKVENKENFWKIARTNGINLETIIGANPWLEDLLARRGREMIILNKRGVLHLVRRGESLSAIADLYRVPVGDIRKANALFPFVGVRAGSVVFIPGAGPKLMTRTIYDNFQKRKIFISPASGKYTSGFGWREHPLTHARNFHTGLDIRAKYGALVWAAAGGIVIVAGEVSGYGNLVIIQHANGFTTYYGHNSAVLVHSGQKVHKGQPIARAGHSGTATGTHVHFEVRKDNKPDNPASYIW